MTEWEQKLQAAQAQFAEKEEVDRNFLHEADTISRELENLKKIYEGKIKDLQSKT